MPEDPKLAYAIEEVVHLAPVGRTSVFAAIANGDLVARKNGRRTLVLRADLEDWLQKMPAVSR